MRQTLAIGIFAGDNGNHLRALLRSILEQIEEPIEIVVFDIGCKKEVKHVIYDARKEYPFVRAIESPALSSLDKVEYALRHLHAEYVWLLGTHEVLLPGALTKIQKLLVRYPDLTGISVDVQGYDVKGRQLRPMHRPIRMKRSHLFSDPIHCYRKLSGWLCVLSYHILHREKLLQAIHDKDTAYHAYPVATLLVNHPRWYYLSEKCLGKRLVDSNARDYRGFIHDLATFVKFKRRSAPSPKRLIESELAHDLNWRFFKMKLRGLSSEAIRTIFRVIFLHYRRCPAFWLRFLPLYLAPRWGLFLFDRFMRLFNWQMG